MDDSNLSYEISIQIVKKSGKNNRVIFRHSPTFFKSSHPSNPNVLYEKYVIDLEGRFGAAKQRVDILYYLTLRRAQRAIF